MWLAAKQGHYFWSTNIQSAPKVIHPKYYKHWLYTLATTIDCRRRLAYFDPKKYIFITKVRSCYRVSIPSNPAAQWGVSSVPFPFKVPFHLHFNIVSSIIALVPNGSSNDWVSSDISSDVSSLYLKRDRTRRCLSF